MAVLWAISWDRFTGYTLVLVSAMPGERRGDLHVLAGRVGCVFVLPSPFETGGAFLPGFGAASGCHRGGRSRRSTRHGRLDDVWAAELALYLLLATACIPVVCRHAGAAQGVGTVVGSRLHLHQFSILQQGTAAQHLHGCVVNCGCPLWTWAGTLTERSCWTACGRC